MKKKEAFAITLELVLVILLCSAVVGLCLAAFTDNLSNLFDIERNYKRIFERVAD